MTFGDATLRDVTGEDADPSASDGGYRKWLLLGECVLWRSSSGCWVLKAKVLRATRGIFCPRGLDLPDLKVEALSGGACTECSIAQLLHFANAAASFAFPFCATAASRATEPSARCFPALSVSLAWFVEEAGDCESSDARAARRREAESWGCGG